MILIQKRVLWQKFKFLLMNDSHLDIDLEILSQNVHEFGCDDEPHRSDLGKMTQ